MAILSMLIFGCNLQNKLLYYPSSSMPSEKALAAVNLKFWPSGSGHNNYRGLTSILDTQGPKSTIIVFHGNGGTAIDRDFYVNILGNLGYRVILAEYPGYGGRKGELGEKTFVDDARETVRLASEKSGGRIFILGESLGCGVAAAAAKDNPVNISGIILITPWDTLQSIAKEKFSSIMVWLLLKDRYDTVSNLKSFYGKIVVVGASRDEIIPVKHATDLYASLSGSKRMWTIGGAGHNDWLMHVDARFWEELMGFISSEEQK